MKIKQIYRDFKVESNTSHITSGYQINKQGR